jgi:hypothetical protein
MVGSLPFNEKKGCPPGFHKRSSYTSKAGHRVYPRCVKSRSVYRESSKEFTRRVLQRQSRRLQSRGKSATRKVPCPPGKIERRGYVRKFASTILRKGYTVRKASGKEYRIYPEHKAVYVKPGCVKDRGLPGKLGPGEDFGTLRRGELKKHGYVYNKVRDERHAALRMAVKEFSPIGVYHKLDAIAKLSKRTIPEASRVFKMDREWIKTQYDLAK